MTDLLARVLELQGLLAEYEQAQRARSERIKAGIQAARMRGMRIGSPPTDPKVVAQARKMLQKGMGIRQTARALNIGPSTVMKVRDGGFGRCG